ncbi:MAG TPA: LuxR C-terminal-related transcriptional regulator [Bacteroidales bacterium]
METLQQINYAYDARKIFGQLPTDLHLEGRKAELIDLKEIKSLFMLCNQFFYITEISTFSNVYVSENIKRILGYEPDDFFDMNFVYSNIHPEDREFVYEFTKKTIRIARKYAHILKVNPYSAVFSIDYRMRCRNGNYIRINRQACCYKTDALGNMIYAMSILTDINHIKQSNLITYAWQADIELDFTMDDLIERFQNKILTPREQEVIRLLSQGLSATEISRKLFISPNTVIRHRKNILHKTGAKNTAELIRYAMEMGLI